jgi:hypothetical protein
MNTYDLEAKLNSIEAQLHCIMGMLRGNPGAQTPGEKAENEILCARARGISVKEQLQSLMAEAKKRSPRKQKK